jgi:2-dehydropantoate 2-reductase
VDIGIVGAGGIGSYYAGTLSRAGHQVRLVTRGEHLAVTRQRGLEVRTPDDSFVVHPEVSDDGSIVAKSEYVLVSVKSYSLNEVGPTLVAAATNGATIVPLLNGADVADRLAGLGVPGSAIVGGIIHASLVRTEPGVVQRKSPGDRVTIGEFDRSTSERTSRLVDAFAGAGSTATLSPDITRDIWRKFSLIVPMGIACGLSRQPMGPVLASESGRKLLTGSLHEVAMVARAVAGTLDDADESKVRDDLFAIGPTIKPSFLLDLERGGPTELDLLAGTVRRLGRQHGVPTPIADLANAAFEVATAGGQVDRWTGGQVDRKG